MHEEKRLYILDTTLRDGSYAIDFQFTTDDTALIVSALESAGITHIEVGHGLGLGASRAGKGTAAATDEEYITSAVRAADKAQIAVFFIPGIGSLDDIRAAAENGLSILRVGTDVTRSQETKPYIEAAKKLGLMVCCNFMKSYAVTPQEFANRVREVENFGADMAYLVDSAGGMLPNEIKQYIDSARNVSNLPLGFHGHDNLRMALANTLAAWDAGAKALDASLLGMGRSEGNCPTEVLVAVLQKRNLCIELDVNRLLDIGEAFIAPLAFPSKPTSLGITAGRARFHSSFLSAALDVASKYNLDVRQLILALGEEGVVGVSQELLEQRAKQLIGYKDKRTWNVAFGTENSSSQATLADQAKLLAQRLRSEAKKQALPSVLNVVLSNEEPAHVSPYVETSFGCAISNIMVENMSQAMSVLQTCDTLADYFLVDLQNNVPDDPAGFRSRLMFYSDTSMWAHAVSSQIAAILRPALTGKMIVILGSSRIVPPTVHMLLALGATVAVEHSSVFNTVITHERLIAGGVTDLLSTTDCLIGLSPRCPVVMPENVSALPAEALVFDGGIGSLHPDALVICRKRGLRAVRIDLRPALAAQAIERINMLRVVHEHMGKTTWKGVPVVAGGVIGDSGDIIVDSITKPKRIIGIADGKGGILPAPPQDKRVQKVRELIALRLLGGSLENDG